MAVARDQASIDQAIPVGYEYARARIAMAFRDGETPHGRTAVGDGDAPSPSDGPNAGGMRTGGAGKLYSLRDIQTFQIGSAPHPHRIAIRRCIDGGLDRQLGR